VSPRPSKAQRLRSIPDPEDEPQVVRAPPDPSSGEGDGERQGGRRSGRAPAEDGAVRAPSEGGAVRAPPDRGSKRATTSKQSSRAAAAPRPEPVVEVDAPGEVRMPDDDEPPRRRAPAANRAGSGETAERVAPREAPQGPESGGGEGAGAERQESAAAPVESAPAPAESAEPALAPVVEIGSGAGGGGPEHDVEIVLDNKTEEDEPSAEAQLQASPDVEIEFDSGSPEAEPAAEEPAQSAAGRTEPERVKLGGDTAEFPESARTWSGVTPPSRRGSSSRFLTDVIVEMGFVTKEAMDAAVETGRNSGSAPERVLVDAGTLSPDGLARALAERYGLDHIDISSFPVDPAAVSLVTSQAAKRYQAVPVAFVDDSRTLLVAMADPSNVLAVDDIAIMTGNEVRVAVASPQDVSDLISRMDRLDAVVAEPEGGTEEELEADTGDVVNLHENADDAPVVKLVNQIVAQAVEQGASDVHLSPTEKDLRVRFRVDGVLRDITTVPRRMAAGIVSRVKIMSELDIAERRLPQDGRVGLTVDGRHVDLRIVTLPSAKGESVTMRILDKGNVVMEFDKLGMGTDDRARFEAGFNASYGAVLVCGPTGSGKTTSLYAALTALNTKERNIITVEDPVEYQMEGITQVQVSPKVGLTFAVGLRTMVRADPDVIMVGEIRDRETAEIAVESALTGHLVLSTLHTNDAPSAIHRLIDMEIEPFLVSSAVECVLSQRLARTLCPHCKKRGIVTADALRASGYNAQVDMEVNEPVGCPRCGGSGYRGRIALYEVLTMSREIRELTLERRSAEEIRDVAVSQGMRRMRDDGFEKVRQGLTSIPEVMRVIGGNG
jgi:type IV pilus assembly protein PilB